MTTSTYQRRIPTPESLIAGVACERDEARAALQALLTQAEVLETAAEALALNSPRWEEARAAEDAAGLFSLAADALRTGIVQLERIETGDLIREIEDRADEARAQALGGVS